MFRERHRFAAGETIHLRPEPGKTHLFEEAGGARMRTA
jgi:hypothetical protein